MPVALLAASALTETLSAAESVGDERSSAIVYAVVGILLVVGIALICLAVWLWRATAPDRQLLAPLEMMDDPTWRRRDPQGRRRALDDVRPDGAQPLVPSVSQPNVDDEFDEVPPVADFTDLSDEHERPRDPLVIDIAADEDDGWDLVDDIEQDETSGIGGASVPDPIDTDLDWDARAPAADDTADDDTADDTDDDTAGDDTADDDTAADTAGDSRVHPG